MRFKFLLILILFLLIPVCYWAQNTSRYTQYTLNNLGMNPAYAGAYQNKVEAVLGRRNQWYGFEGAPVTTFLSVNYGYRPNYSYKGWHGFSAYIEEDKTALFSNKSAYLGYAYHFRLFTGVNIGFGLMAGVRTFGLGSGLVSTNDPAFFQTKKFIYTYPDFIPGFRLYSKKMFLDVSIRQLYKNRMQQGDSKIGVNSKIPPHYYITYGYKVRTGYSGLMVVPSVHVQSALVAIPQVDLNCMFYYRSKVGAGVNVRVGNSVSGILQVNALRNVVVGFAYDYTTSKFRSAATNTYEFMVGISPVMASDEKVNRNRVANCPTFDF